MSAIDAVDRDQLRRHVVSAGNVQVVTLLRIGQAADLLGVSADTVRRLVASIGDVGLLHPVILTPESELIAGRKRIAAFVELGLTHIEARIATLGMLEREVAEIDENMIRRHLPVLERGRQLVRRKELYEALHPEARQHVRGGNAKAAAATERISPAPAFATDAAAKLIGGTRLSACGNDSMSP